ncbi:Anaphase-promoting complex subunit 5 [Bienertia sinuspersici]
MTSIGSSLSVHQQLYVLLRRALARSEGLKLTPLMSANHLAMAKFDLMTTAVSVCNFMCDGAKGEKVASEGIWEYIVIDV